MENLEIKIPDELEVDYKDKKVFMKDTQLFIEIPGDAVPAQIKMITEFRPESLNVLLDDFPQIKYGTENQIYTFTFRMKAESIKKYASAFAKALSFTDWLSAGEGACLKLENYEYVITGAF